MSPCQQVLVLDADQLSTLAVVRSLGRSGCGCSVRVPGCVWFDLCVRVCMCVCAGVFGFGRVGTARSTSPSSASALSSGSGGASPWVGAALAR